MRYLFIIGCLTGLLKLSGFAQSKINIEVNNLRSKQGMLYFSLFKSGDGFPSEYEKAFKRGKIEIDKSDVVKFSFDNIPAGTYAISLFHDEDNDGKVKMNKMKMPLEGTGASNNARGKMGPPKYNDALFEVDKTEVNMKLKVSYYNPPPPKS